MEACEQSSEVEAEVNDPGAAPYGNFINYYTFNPPENRLSLIPASILQDLDKSEDDKTLVLDVGCNSGDLTVAFYKHLHQAAAEPPQRQLHILGFDLDETLIERANRANPFPDNVSFISLDVTADTEALQDFLRLYSRPRFHLCLCLAVTMWIHLHHGDQGLLRLLSDLASRSERLLLEAQPWKCYRAAARRLRKLGRSDFQHFKTLGIRGDMAGHAREHLEKSCGMELVQSFGSTTWDRKLLLFRRR